MSYFVPNAVKVVSKFLFLNAVAYHKIFALHLDRDTKYGATLLRVASATCNSLSMVGQVKVERTLLNRAGKGSMEEKEMPALNDKHIQRIIEYLRSMNWTEEKILEFIAYITQ